MTSAQGEFTSYAPTPKNSTRRNASGNTIGIESPSTTRSATHALQKDKKWQRKRSVLASKAGSAPGPAAVAVAEGRAAQGLTKTLKEMVKEGSITTGFRVLRVTHKGVHHFASLNQRGKITLNQRAFATPSALTSFIKGEHDNGWASVVHVSKDGTETKLEELRRRAEGC